MNRENKDKMNGAFKYYERNMDKGFDKIMAARIAVNSFRLDIEETRFFCDVVGIKSCYN